MALGYWLVETLTMALVIKPVHGAHIYLQTSPDRVLLTICSTGEPALVRYYRDRYKTKRINKNYEKTIMDD